MINQKLLLLVIVFFIVLIPKLGVNQNLSKEIAFTFTLKKQGVTSAGVFSGDGRLLRTLWSEEPYNPGVYTRQWDGKYDNGLPAIETDYSIKVLSNNVKTIWEGVLGNTSDDMTGVRHIRPSNEITCMAILGNNAYYTTGYNEQKPSTFKLNTKAPNSTTTPIFGKGMYGCLVATDGNIIYWAGYDPNIKSNSFVFGTNISDDQQNIFSQGVPYKTKHGGTYISTIDLVAIKRSAPSGLAVQKRGTFIFVARDIVGTIDVLDKKSGALIKTITNFSRPRGLATDGNDNLWIISDSNTVSKYAVNNDGTLSPPLLSLDNIISPLSISISPDNVTVCVIDASPQSQQIKAYNNSTGKSLWTLGQVGGYYVDPAVTNYKFYFSDAQKIYSTFIAYQPDGSFWVMDAGNCRLQHYSASRVFINRVEYRIHSYSTGVDKNNPVRVFSDYLEFAVDYSKPLDNGANGSWTLVNNWGANVTADQDNKYQRLKGVATLKNGRTYALALLGKNQWEIVELAITGLRFTGTRYSAGSGKDYLLYPDGSLRAQTKPTLGTPIYFYEKNLTGFDDSNNPEWGDEHQIALSSPLQSGDPVYDGNRSCLQPGEITTSGVIAVFNASGRTGGYHLGGVKIGDNGWLWKTAASTSADYTGDYPPAGYFDIGNKVNSYAGSKALALGRSIFWGYHGEFWKSSQVNKWTQVYDDGLIVQTFGVTGIDSKITPFAGMAGNAFSAIFITNPNDTTSAYMYQNDEEWHAGIHRWKISGLNTISEQVATISPSSQ